MNYMQELNAFRNWVLINRLSTGQIALWYSLMSINNMAGWAEWFTSPNQTLQLMTGLSRQGLDKARLQLVQAGRIHYKKGKSNQAGSYKMIPLVSTECKKVGTEVGTGGALQLSQEGRKSSTLLDIDLDKTKDKHITPSDNQLTEAKSDINEIFNHWNAMGIIKHRTLTQKTKSAINARLREFSIDELMQAITIYKEILEGDQYYYSHKFTLEKFMNHDKVISFTEENEPHKTYLKFETGRRQPDAKPRTSNEGVRHGSTDAENRENKEQSQTWPGRWDHLADL